MTTNYSQYDKVKGKEVWGVLICLALAAGLLIGGVKYCNNYKKNYNSSQEIKVVSQNSLEGLTIKEKYRRK
jgi:high-affinity Fe2+/Pb2+ permease